MSNTTFDMKADTKLEALVNQTRELKSFYTDTIAIEKAKMDYCVFLMNTRGTKVSKDADADDEAASD